MKITAVVAEYNPFTSGHAYHIRKVKEETGADAVLAVMSGSFTQRGDAAVSDKYLRAAAAVECGVDVVFELPTVFALSPAEYFALGAVKMLAEIKEIDCLSFGSECGDLTLLEKAAELSLKEPPELSAAIKARLDGGTAYPKAYAEAVAEFSENREEYRGVGGIYDKPNNVLAVSYIAAAKKIGWKVKFHTVKRIGADYGDLSSDCDFPSATAVREAVLSGRTEDIKNAVPSATYKLLSEYRGNADALGDMILYKLKQTDARTLLTYRGFDTKDGLLNRLKTAADASFSYDEFLKAAKTKNYTMARIKRLSLCALLEIGQNAFEAALELPSYYQVLAVKKSCSAELFSALSYLPNFITKYSDADAKTDKRLRSLIELDKKAQDILSIVNRDGRFERVMLVVE